MYQQLSDYFRLCIFSISLEYKLIQNDKAAVVSKARILVLYIVVLCIVTLWGID